MDQNALYDLSYGLYAVGVKEGSRDCGCIINTTFQINSVDPLIAISMNKENYTHALIEKEQKFTISVLSEDVDPNVISALGFVCGMDHDKWSQVDNTYFHELAVVSKGANAHLYCEVVSSMDANTHTVYLAKVIDAQVVSEQPSMTYAYYHNVLKGKAPKKAPTYQEEELSTTPKWVCSVCGYVYDGPNFEEELDSYTCPLCHVPKKMFEQK